MSFFVEFLLWPLLVLLFLLMLSVSPLSRFTGSGGPVSRAFLVFFGARFQSVFSVSFFQFFFAFGCPGGGPGGAFFSLGSSSSAEAGTFDFERQYNVFGVFSTFGGFPKQRKSNKKVLENLLFFRGAQKPVRYRFSRFLGSLLDAIFESRAEKMDLEMVLFSRTCFGSSPGEAQAHFGVLLVSLWRDFWRCL